MMGFRKPGIVVGCVFLIFNCRADCAGEKRPITVEDCVRTRRVAGGQVEITTDGARIAYVLKTPDLTTNKNWYQLFVLDLKRRSQRENARLLLQSDELSGLKWLADGKRVIVLSRDSGKQGIVVLDVSTGNSEVVAAPAADIVSFSANATGDTVVFNTNSLADESKDSEAKSERGFPVIFGKGTEVSREAAILKENESQIYLVKRDEVRRRETIAVSDPGVAGSMKKRFFYGVKSLSLSPDGNLLTFSYFPERIPESWKANPYYRFMAERNISTPALGLLNLRTGQFRIAFDAPLAGWGFPTVWADDSLAFTVNALSPAGSAWEAQDVGAGFKEAIQVELYTHLFAVDVKTGSVFLVLSKPSVWYRNDTFCWKRNTDNMLVFFDNHTFARMRPQGSTWKVTSRFEHSSLGEIDLRTPLVGGKLVGASDGKVVVGVKEAPMIPPYLFLYNLEDGQASLLVDLNPKYREIVLGQVEKIEWKNRYGAECSGQLIKPVDYEAGKRYPLVIMTKGWGNSFLSDTHFRTAFPPQPLANAGFLILLANLPDPQRDPKDYPGRMGEVYNWMAMVEGAVGLLVERGLADKDNVGIIGFSRTSWETDFMLTHSDVKFAAASSADSGIYNYGAYWMQNSGSFENDSEGQLGGPPYGATFQNWLKYAPAFNADHVRAPLLMEYIGQNLDAALEFFVALKRQNKAVELFSYPKGEHSLDTPFERVASLQRNVDWFRFWMQGYEGKAPDYDPDQYVRWRELRKQHEENLAGCGKKDTSTCRAHL